MALLKALMPDAFRRRIDSWIEKRNPTSTSAITLINRRLYILPTRFGYIYALMLIVLLLAAINYQNSMAYALTFLLTAIGIISLWQTHKNLLGLGVELKTPEPVFQGNQLFFVFNISNHQQATRYAVGIQYDKHAPAYTSVDPDTTAQLELILDASKRGLFKPGGFTLFTRYPTGLFHAWGWIKFDLPVLIYPAPLYDLTLQQSLIDDHSGKSTVDIADGDDFAGLREYRAGESLRHISWKAYAQGRGMLTKTFQGHATPSLWINWSDMSASSIEGKLSQMTALVIQAQQAGRKFGLKLPSISIDQDSGNAHQADCLRHLALYQQAQAGEEYHV
jgi:uncharacterized protein (DUF58 family)